MKDNTNTQAKQVLREYFLSKMEKDIKILECFAGENRVIYKQCYKKYDTTSLDIKSIDGVVKCDNLKYIASHDISEYCFFDLDAYGDPYVLLLNIFHRLPSDNKKRCMVITDGLHRNLIYGNAPFILSNTMNNKKKIQIPHLHKWHEYIVKLFLIKVAAKYNIFIEDVKIFRDNSVSHMLYFGFIFHKDTLENKKHQHVDNSYV